MVVSNPPCPECAVILWMKLYETQAGQGPVPAAVLGG